MAKAKKTVKKASRGLKATDVGVAKLPAEHKKLAAAIAADGGELLASYRDPLGGNLQLLCALPLDRVEPTPFQRDLSETHAKRMAEVLDRLDRFVDPIIVVRTEEGAYWTPNGNHRLDAVRRLGGRSIVALLIPDFDVAFQILALNTEKAHNVKEKSLEVIRMARLLATMQPLAEEEFSAEFEESFYLTFGVCYEKKARFSGSAYQPVLKRVDAFVKDKLPEALKLRAARGELLLALDDAVAKIVAGLKERGVESSALKNAVVAQLNPLGKKKTKDDTYDQTLQKMIASAKDIDLDQLAAALAGED